MALPYDICIRGAGIVGRTLALLLARDRLRIALVPGPLPQDEPPDVRAYALNSASRSLLEGLRAWPQAEHVTPVLRMQVQGDLGAAVQFDAHEQGAEALAWIVDVPALEQRLADAVHYQPQIETVDAPVNAPLTVVCEGKASRTREEFAVAYDVTPYPQHALATRLRCSQAHGQVARQWFLDDGILALLPMGGPQGQEVAVVWSVDPTQAAELSALPETEFALRLQAASQGAVGTVALSGPRAVWPLQKAQAQRWCGPWPGVQQSPGAARSWVLAGDAAHTVHPLAGQGLNLGLGDAAALARALHGRDYWRSVADLRVLRAYERERKAAAWPMLLATDGLQQLFGRSDEALVQLRRWGMAGFDRSGPLKRWIARQAMGTSA
ncbi:MAG: FAD-dependent monooxygenase [Burkholderiaceae bacterium]